MKRPVLILVAVLLTGIAATAAQTKEWSFPSTRSYGRATTQYRNQGVQVVINYDYSQRNHNTKWLLIDLAIASRQRFVMHKDHIKLLTPKGGRELGVAPQEAIIADSAGVTKLLQNAKVNRQSLLMYFSQRGGGPVETIRFQTFPIGGGTVSPEVTVDDDHVSDGAILFVTPEGRWDAGTYRLEITNEVAKAALPIKLE
jgi:hypothetical protein